MADDLLDRALAYIHAHPGMSARQITTAIGNGYETPRVVFIALHAAARAGKCRRWRADPDRPWRWDPPLSTRSEGRPDG